MEREWETSMDESCETNHAESLTQVKGEREVDRYEKYCKQESTGPSNC